QATDENNRIIQAAIGGTSYSNSYEYILYANGTVGNRGHSGIDLSSLNNVTQVAAAHNGYFGAAVKADGTVWSWGDNANGQIGDGTSGTANNKTTPVQVGGGGSNAMKLRKGAILDDTQNDGIARDHNGNKLEYTKESELLTNVYIEENQKFRIDKDIKMTTNFSLLKADAIVEPNNLEYESLDKRIAITDRLNDGTGIVKPVGDVYGTVVIRVKDGDGISKGSGQTAILRVNVRPAKSVATPMVAAGQSHMIALKADGTVWAWGDNNKGQLGIDKSRVNVPKQVLTGEQNADGGFLENIIQVTAGTNFSAALDRDRQVWTWGEGTDGKLGLGDTGNRQYPTKVSITDVVFITAGPRNMFAIRADGSLWAWGYSYSAQESSLGTNGGSTSVPTRVLGGASGSA
ncbi:hypothetical protein FMM68_12695, partial [Lachnospiraceae bacterium MD329]|nr:hypothetical protein [Lachnospiraceae bacterium MD329]